MARKVSPRAAGRAARYMLYMFPPMPELITHDGLALVVERPAPGAPKRAPVLLVHGVFVGAGSLKNAQQGLAARGHGTAAVHLRGRFGSRPVDDIGRVGIADFVNDVIDAARYLERVCKQPPVLLGHSMGGLLVQKAAEAGVGVAAVLVCPAPPRGIVALTARIARRMAPYVPAMLLSRPAMMSREDADDVALNCVPPERRAAIYAEDFVRDSGRALREMALGVPVDARRVHCPVLCLAGADDRFVPARTVQKVAARYGARYRVYQGHGHVLFEEPGWERPLAETAEWIEAVTAGAAGARAGTSAAGGGK